MAILVRDETLDSFDILRNNLSRTKRADGSPFHFISNSQKPVKPNFWAAVESIAAIEIF